jgi:hypothetical protein
MMYAGSFNQIFRSIGQSGVNLNFFSESQILQPHSIESSRIMSGIQAPQAPEITTYQAILVK